MDASQQDVLVPDAGGDIQTTDATDASCDVSKEATTSTLISQDIFSPEDSGTPLSETIQEEAPLPSQEKTVVSPSFDMFAPSQETESVKGVVESAASGRQVPGSVVDASVLLDKRDAAGLKPTEESETGDDAMETSDVCRYKKHPMSTSYVVKKAFFFSKKKYNKFNNVRDCLISEFGYVSSVPGKRRLRLVLKNLLFLSFSRLLTCK